MKRLLMFLVLITCVVGMVFATGGKEQAAPADGTEIIILDFPGSSHEFL